MDLKHIGPNGGLNIFGILARLETWAPVVLSWGSKASEDDLLAIMELRAEADREVPKFLEAGNAAPFLTLTRADSLCAPFASTLLYVSRERLDEVMKTTGLTLNPNSWFGIHLWEPTEAVGGWVAQSTLQPPVHVAEAVMSLELLWASEDRGWWNEAFIGEDGFYRKSLGAEALSIWESQIVKARSADPKEEFWEGVKKQGSASMAEA